VQALVRWPRRAADLNLIETPLSLFDGKSARRAERYHADGAA